MIDYIFIVMVTSLWVTGLQIASQETMILYRPATWLEKRWPGNPILTCRWCMPTVHVPVVMCIMYFLLGELQLPFKMLVGYYIVTVPASSFLAGVCFNLVLNTIPVTGDAELIEDAGPDFIDDLKSFYGESKFN